MPWSDFFAPLTLKTASKYPNNFEGDHPGAAGENPLLSVVS